MNTQDELLAVFSALGHPQRLRIIAALGGGRVHVSELARRLGLSRPLLYMHLAWLEKAHLVAGHLELSPDGKAHKFFELAPFDLRINAETIINAAASGGAATAASPQGHPPASPAQLDGYPGGPAPATTAPQATGERQP